MPSGQGGNWWYQDWAGGLRAFRNGFGVEKSHLKDGLRMAIGQVKLGSIASQSCCKGRGGAWQDYHALDEEIVRKKGHEGTPRSQDCETRKTGDNTRPRRNWGLSATNFQTKLSHVLGRVKTGDTQRIYKGNTKTYRRFKG